MSNFLLVTGNWAARLASEPFAALVRRSLGNTGDGTCTGQSAPGVATIATSHGWEDALSGASPLCEQPPLLVAADATLYYQKDLGARLSGEEGAVQRRSSAQLIALAYTQFGSECLTYLEGDFAFALWDSRTGKVFAARDPFGARGLYFAARNGAIAVASTPDPLRLLLDDPGIDHRSLIRSIVGYHGAGDVSPWKGISELPAGWSLSAQRDGVPQTLRFWRPARSAEWSRASSRDAAVILRELLADATVERMPHAGAAVAMSGGRDSTALVGSVEQRRRQSSVPSVPRLTVLSYKYPADDPGNEDAYVNSVASGFDLPVNWIDTDTIPVFRDAIANAGRRARPEAQPFEGVNRALGIAAHQHGLPVVLNGNGGDNLFGLPDIWLADLLRSARFFRLNSELRTRRYPRRSWFVQACLRPAVPLFLMDGAETILGRRLLSRPWERHAPDWLGAGLLEREGIIDEDRRTFKRDITDTASSVEERVRLWALLYAGFSRNCAALYEMVRDVGAELRMPFYDQRVVRFAWSRSAADLNDGTDHKVVLRRSMEEILPAEVAAIRPARTGTSEGYFLRMAAKEGAEFFRPLKNDPLLAQLGLVDAKLLQARINCWDKTLQNEQVFLVNACNVELWLRAHI